MNERDRLAADLRSIHGGPAPWPGAMTSEQFADSLIALGWRHNDDDIAYEAGREDGLNEAKHAIQEDRERIRAAVEARMGRARGYAHRELTAVLTIIDKEETE